LSLKASVRLIHHLFILKNLDVVFIASVYHPDVIGLVTSFGRLDMFVYMVEVTGKTRFCEVLTQVLVLALRAWHYDRIVIPRVFYVAL